ncbi:glycosyltransferase family 39 protein [Rathayibacter sp. CAU 1779]
MLEYATTSIATAVQVRPKRHLWVVALSTGAFAMAVSMLGSWVPSLWGDEAASLLSAKRPLGSLFTMLTHVDAVHGSYYVMLHFWVRLAGTSPFAVRLPSAVAIGVAAAAVAWLCGRMHSTRLAVLAGLIAAVLPRLTDVGEEARGYAFDAAICAVLCVVVAELVLRGGRATRLWIAYGVLLAVGTYLFLYDVLMAVAIGAFLAFTPTARRHLRAWVIATGSAVLAASPLIVFAVLERGQVSYLQHRSEVTPSTVFVQMWFGTTAFAIVAWLLIVVALGDLAYRIVQRRRIRGSAVTASRPDAVVLAACWLFLPAGLLIAASPVMAGYTARYGAFAAPAAAVLMAAGIDRLARRTWIAVGLAAIVLVTAAPVWVSQRTPYAMNNSDWNEIAATVQAQARPGDGILFDGSVRPSRRTRLAMDTDPSAFAKVKDLALDVPYAENTTWHDSTYSIAHAAALGRFDRVDRVWVVEYATTGHTDTWGVSSLEGLGFHKTAHYSSYRSVTYLFTR